MKNKFQTTLNTTVQATIAVSLLVALTACGSRQAPVSIEKSMTPSPWGAAIPLVTITSKVNNVKLTDLKINRGNCIWGASQKRLPVDMVFGQTLSYVALGCQIEEVEIKTDQGDYTFTF